jgi:hypothetical protein
MLNKDSEKEKSIIPIEVVSQRIFFIRGLKVMLDADLAELYAISTARLNEQVKRNKDRFPQDFMFQLNDDEFENLRSQIATSSWGGRRILPYAFTEHGVAMLPSVLRSPRAVQMNILKLQNKHINSIYSMLEKLISEPVKPSKPIGFSRP